MITLEQHLAAHPLYYNEDEWKTSPWVCKCKWTIPSCAAPSLTPLTILKGPTDDRH